jgi:hypothetical protein
MRVEEKTMTLPSKNDCRWHAARRDRLLADLAAALDRAVAILGELRERP